MQNRRRLNAHLQPFHILRLPQRFVGAHLLETVVPIRQSDDPFALQLVQELLADGTERHPVRIGIVIEDVGQIEHLELGQAERSEFRQARCQHLD